MFSTVIRFESSSGIRNMLRKSTENATKGRKLLVGFLAARNHSLDSQEIFQRNVSVSSLDAKPTKISDNISFRSAFDSHLDTQQRPIVLLYGWLVAKARHIHKYGDFYLGKGFDVVHVKLKPDQFLRPAQAQNVVGHILDFVSEGERAQQPILQHGFSVGAYLYGETLVKISGNLKEYADVGRRIRGQILDSPVEFYRVPYGVSRALTSVSSLQNLIESGLNSYLRVFYKSTTRHYIKAQEIYLENKFQIPTLYMYSHSDIIGDPIAIETSAKSLRERGIHVESVCFEGSGHVGHFHRNPVKYIEGLQSFLGNIGLLQELHDKERLRV